MRLTDFRVLSFDCYGTLVDWESGIRAAIAPWLEGQGREVPREEILAAFAHAEAGAEAARPGAPYPEILADVHRQLARDWGLAPSDKHARAFAASVGDWPPFADTAAALRYLKGHFELVILSNVDRDSFARTAKKLGVAFDAVYTAEDIGGYKPDPRNFQYMLDRLRDRGVGKEHILHVAQSLYHDHVPARKLGLATCWINRRKGAPGTGATRAPGEAVEPDFQAESLAGLVAQHRACKIE